MANSIFLVLQASNACETAAAPFPSQVTTVYSGHIASNQPLPFLQRGGAGLQKYMVILSTALAANEC